MFHFSLNLPTNGKSKSKGFPKSTFDVWKIMISEIKSTEIEKKENKKQKQRHGEDQELFASDVEVDTVGIQYIH